MIATLLTRTVLPAALTGLLLAGPPAATAGNPYCGTCGYGTTYAQSYAPTYTSGPIYYPPGYYPGTVSYSNYAPADYTFFRPGQDLINARLAQEAATAAVDKLKAELAAREQAAAQAAKDQADAAFKQQTLAALQALAAQQRVAVAAPPVDPRTAQLEADNATLKETLKKLLDQKARAPAPPAPGPDAPPALPPVPKADAGPPVPQPPAPPVAQNPPPGKGDANVLTAVQTFFNGSCTRCHGDASAPRMNLAHAEKLTYEDLSDCIARMASPVKELAMPKDKPGTVTAEQVYPVQLLQASAPRRQR